MTTRANIDWEAIQSEYKAGQLSVREIGRQNNISYQAILKHAKRRGWKRDLTNDVQKEIQQKLITQNAGVTDPHAKDADIIDQASDRTIKVINAHRVDLGRLFNIIATLLTELEGSPGADKKSGIIRDLSQAYAKLIPLVRQSYNIDSKTPSGSESDPIYVKHSMDTSGLSKAAGAPIKDVTPKIPQLPEGTKP